MVITLFGKGLFLIGITIALQRGIPIPLKKMRRIAIPKKIYYIFQKQPFIIFYFLSIFKAKTKTKTK
jgi:hypothetical protein